MTTAKTRQTKAGTRDKIWQTMLLWIATLIAAYNWFIWFNFENNKLCRMQIYYANQWLSRSRNNPIRLKTFIFSLDGLLSEVGDDVFLALFIRSRYWVEMETKWSSCYNARVQVQSEYQYSMRLDRLSLPEPLSIRDSTSVSEQLSNCNLGMQVDWWFQPKSVFDHIFIGII